MREITSNTPDQNESGAASENETKTNVTISEVTELFHSPGESRFDQHLGEGVVFRVGTEGRTQLELYAQMVRVSTPRGQAGMASASGAVRPEGLVFEHPDAFLSVSPTGEVVFAYSPPNGNETPIATESQTVPHAEPRSAPPVVESDSPPLSRQSEKADRGKVPSERYVGRMGEVRMHQNRAGKLVAEVEITVNNPEHPGASKLVKFAAFGAKAETLRDRYHPGQLVTAVGIPHDVRRRNREGREWVEHQLYFVQLPKPR